MNDLADLVTEYFQRMGFSSLEQCRRALGITDKRGINGVVANLRSSGVLREAPGMGINGVIFEYVREPDPRRPHDLMEKAWRAMRLSKVFSAWDIAMYSGASLDYCHRYIRHLARKGILVKFGRNDKQRFTYRIADGHDSTTAPAFNSSATRRERNIQEAIESGWHLMRALRAGDTAAAKESLSVIGLFLQDAEGMN